MNTLKERLEKALKGPPKRTKASLAKACGIAAPSVSDWFSGKTKTLEASNLLAAANFLKVNPRWLADGIGPMYDSQSGKNHNSINDIVTNQVLLKKSEIELSNEAQELIFLIKKYDTKTKDKSWFKALKPLLVKALHQI